MIKKSIIVTIDAPLQNGLLSSALAARLRDKGRSVLDAYKLNLGLINWLRLRKAAGSAFVKAIQQASAAPFQFRLGL